MTNTQALTVQDLEDALEIIESVVTDLGQDQIEELATMFENRAALGNQEKMRIGLIFTRMISRHARGKLFDILARARGESSEEFRKQGAVQAVTTLQAIFNDERNRDFFTQLRLMLPNAAKAGQRKS